MKTFFRRKLPHIQIKGMTFFITFRLYKSLPNEIIKALKQEFRKKLLRLRKKQSPAETIRQEYDRHFEKFDMHLDQYQESPKYLKNEIIASMTAETMMYWNLKKYDLIAYSIMPNHVHMVIEVNDTVGQVNNLSNIYTGLLSPILFSIKRYTARQANIILNREGKFWQHESYDHIVRNETELNNTIRYILMNPVKAGLASNWREWQWNYCKFEISDF